MTIRTEAELAMSYALFSEDDSPAAAPMPPGGWNPGPDDRWPRWAALQASEDEQSPDDAAGRDAFQAPSPAVRVRRFKGSEVFGSGIFPAMGAGDDHH